MSKLFVVAHYDPTTPQNTDETLQKAKLRRLELLNKRKRPQPATPEPSSSSESSSSDSEPPTPAKLPKKLSENVETATQQVTDALQTQLTLPNDNHQRRKLKHTSKLLEHSTSIPSLHSSSYAVDSYSTVLCEPLRQELKKQGISDLFPCQKVMLDHLFCSNFPASVKLLPEQIPCPDLLVRAPTGSGKTLAFVLPILEILQRQEVHRRVVRAIVILPTRTLAKQVASVFTQYGECLGYKTALLTGGTRVSLTYPLLGISKFDIVVATPGRLVDYLDELDVSEARFLVIDEADQVLAESKQDWLSKLESKRRPILPDSVVNLRRCTLPFQKLLFSATLTDSPKIVEPLNMFAPRLLTTNKQFHLPETLKKKYLIVSSGLEKLLALQFLLSVKYIDAKVLIFCNQVQSSERLASLFDMTHISSSIPEVQKRKIISKFAAAKIKHIVCTDQLSRGMDLEADLIIEYDSSRICETYIHRVGRTARAGRTGEAITILKKSQVTAFKTMMKPVTTVRAMKYKPEDLSQFKVEIEEKLESLKQSNDIKEKRQNFNKFSNRQQFQK